MIQYRTADTTFVAFHLDDFLDGGFGNDMMSGGDGNDLMFGGFGDDKLLGGDNDDLLFGNDNDDILVGGAGIDHQAINVISDVIRDQVVNDVPPKDRNIAMVFDEYLKAPENAPRFSRVI